MLMPEFDWSRSRIKKGHRKTGPGLRRYRPGIAADVQPNAEGKTHLDTKQRNFRQNPGSAWSMEIVRQLVGSNSLGS